MIVRTETETSSNPNYTIAVRNVAPTAWSGRKFDVEVYKNKHLYIIQPEVLVGSRVDFVIQPKLYFGVAHNMRVGQTFTSLGVVTANTMFDLDQYPSGITVTLNQLPGGGMYIFSGESM